MNLLEIKDVCRANLNKYTRKAFESIPKIDSPNILDIGCGTGVPTLEIAKLTNGKILAIDSDKESVNRLKEKVKKFKYEDRILVVHDSVLLIKFVEKHFDIIVAEGLFNIIGFEKGLAYFTKFLKKDGYFLIHDEFLNREKKLKIIEKYQYKLLDEITLNEDIWWNEYYSCLEKKLFDTEKVKSDIEMYKKNPKRFRSIYYILKKI